MDVLPVSNAVASTPLTTPPARSVSLTPSFPPRSPEIISAWPRCAELAAAFLLGVLTTLLGIHVASSLRAGTEPAEIVGTQIVTYRVDLNEASRAELLQLPGVGPNLADRIEEYRRAHGGFQSVDELRKVSGIGPATLEKLRPLVAVRAPVQPDEAKALLAPANANANAKGKSPKGLVNINTAALAELQTLPGIGPKLSQRIVDERERKPFASVDDLRRVAGIGVKTLDKLKPYVTVAAPTK
jgi:competence protein ComEA